jgi:hypothetical protein
VSIITVDPHNIEVHVGDEKLEAHEANIDVDVETGDLKPASDLAIVDAVHAKVAEHLRAMADPTILIDNLLLDPDLGIPWFGLSNELLAEMKRAQDEWLERIRTRKQALVNLWSYAASQVRVRHPDPKVQVRVDVQRYGIGDEIRLDFVMFNICDTSYDSENRMWRFRHGATLTEWPGLENAKMWISAAWALYLQHEAFELVTLRDRAGCSWHDGYVEGCPECASNAAIIDAHGMNHHQELLRATGDVKRILKWAIGDAWAEKLLEVDAKRAKADLDNEMAYVKEPWDLCC